MGRYVDLTGFVFGRLTVAERIMVPRGRGTYWRCICACGGEKILFSGAIKAGKTNSCGCILSEFNIARNTRHGMSYSREYGIWMAAKSRCFRPTNMAYKYYGGRGITMCERWRRSFAAFYADMGPCPPGLSIDRIDNNGNYEPENCRWATRKEQANNRPKGISLEAMGESLNFSEWGRKLGIDPLRISARIRLLGMSVDEALTPVDYRKTARGIRIPCSQQQLERWLGFINDPVVQRQVGASTPEGILSILMKRTAEKWDIQI